MHGSVSTLAPVFAGAFVTRNSWDAFLVGLAASVGAGISMGFAEALSDDGTLTGRGHPWIRGVVCGLVPDFRLATTLAVIVVAFELAVISYVRYRYMQSSFVTAAIQVAIGGVLVFAAGILIGSS
jgi:erythrin-vacuolar iron transport family protein